MWISTTARVARVLNRVHVWPIDLDVARTSVRLDFEGDPADGIIAATSVVHDVPLVTRDRVIRQSKIVPLAEADSARASAEADGPDNPGRADSP